MIIISEAIKEYLSVLKKNNLASFLISELLIILKNIKIKLNRTLTS